MCTPNGWLTAITDDLDKQVLLTVQYCCNEAGVRIPWDDVAAVMGPKFTGGAIVQHLSKVRQKMIGLELPVPPPLKRGVVNTPSKIYASGNKRKIGSGTAKSPLTQDSKSNKTNKGLLK